MNRSNCSLLSCSFLKIDGINSLSSLFIKKSDCERIAPVTLYKRATVSESISSIFKKERREWIILFHERIALLITKNEQFDLMIWSDYRIPNPDSHYNKNNPTVVKTTANNKNVSTFRVLGIFYCLFFKFKLLSVFCRKYKKERKVFNRYFANLWLIRSDPFAQLLQVARNLLILFIRVLQYKQGN